MALVIFVIFLTSCREEILHDLSEAQANQAWLTLANRQIDVQKKRGISGWQIAVSTSSAVKALQMLEELKLPHGLWREKDLEAGSIIPSKEERQLTRERQLARSIEGSLLSLPGIDDAHVHLVLPNGDSASKSTASVLVISSRSGSIQPQQLRDLVAGATSIQKESVAVAVISGGDYLQKSNSDVITGAK